MLEHMLASDATHAQITVCVERVSPWGEALMLTTSQDPFVITPQQSGTSGVLHECPNVLM